MPNTKTLRVLTREGWVTKPIADLDENRLTAEEVDGNFLALEDEFIAAVGDIDTTLTAILGT